MAPFASPRVWNTVGHTSSAFKVLKKVSTIELSEQFPIADIEIRTPCFLSKDPPHEVPIGDSRCLRPGEVLAFLSNPMTYRLSEPVQRVDTHSAVVFLVAGKCRANRPSLTGVRCGWRS